VRTLEELINVEDPGIAVVRSWMSKAKNEVTLLEGDRPAGERTLLELQATSRSPMGAIALETGGILVDHGWVRILGSGCARLPRSISAWNRLTDEQHRVPGALLVADDAVGGFYAINGGSLPGEPGNICYLAPDTLEWEDTERGYSDWIWWLFTGDLAGYFADMRFPGWEEEVSRLGGDQALSIYPFLWTSGPPVGERSRKAVPIEEIWGLTQQFQASLGGRG
jgi:hypothetical protein